LAKKKRPAAPRKKTRSFNPENSRWFVPIVFLFMFIALVVLFSDFVFSDQMLHGSDTLQQGYTFREFYVEHFKETGEVPKWIPHYFGGMPYIEAFHGDIFYPFTIIKFFMPLKRALGWSLFFHIFAAGIFMYCAARQFKLSKIASLFSAAIYMFASYLVSMVAPGHDGKMYVTSLFPLVILFLDRGFEKKPLLNFSILGLVIGLILLTPHPQMSYFTLWALSLYAAFRLIVLWRETKSVTPLIRPAVLTTYAVVLGLLLSAVQFYPGYYYTTHFSPRSETKRGWEWATSWSMHEEEAVSVLLPEFAGTMSRTENTYYWGKNWFKDNCETAGSVAFFVALLGIVFWRRKESWFFMGLALFALSYALAGTTPIFKLYFWLIPKVSSLRAPSMIMFLFVFSAALLAGMGVQAIVNARRERPRKISRKFTQWVFGFPAFMLLLALLFTVAGRGMLDVWTTFFYSEAASTLVQQGVSKLDVAYLNLPSIQSGAWLAFLFTGLTALCLWLYRTGRMGTGVLVAMLAIPVVDGVRFDKRFVSLVEPAEFRGRFSSNALSDFLGRIDEKYRVLNLSSPNDNSLVLHGIDVMVGYHGNQLRWYDQLLGGPGLTNIRRPPNMRFTNLQYLPNDRLANLVGLKYMTLPSDENLPPGLYGAKPLVTVVDYGREKLIRNDNAFPRVFLVDQYQVFSDTVIDDSDVTARTAIVREVLRGDEDLRRTVLLEETPNLQYTPDTLSTDSAWIMDYQTDSIVIGLEVASNKILVMTDNYYDAWHASVDGAPAKLLRSYGSFRAVEIPAGSRELSFKFSSPRYQNARLVSLLTAGYLLVIIGLLLWRDRRRQPEPEPLEEVEN